MMNTKKKSSTTKKNIALWKNAIPLASFELSEERVEIPWTAEVSVLVSVYWLLGVAVTLYVLKCGGETPAVFDR